MSAFRNLKDKEHVFLLALKLMSNKKTEGAYDKRHSLESDILAVGMAPYAHLAVYKVCFGPNCPESDILVRLDAAVADGVDGIFVSCAIGNLGPFNGTATNIAQWVLTIGASTTDIKIKATKKLGNNKEFDGSPSSTLSPLVYAGSNEQLVNAVKFNEYSFVVVSAGYDRSLRAWDCRSHSTKPIQIIDTSLDSVMSICLTKTDIIVGSVDGTIRTFDIQIVSIELSNDLGQPVNCISLSNDGRCVLASCLDSSLRLLDRMDESILKIVLLLVWFAELVVNYYKNIRDN
uniref:Uncharacterized protein n=1 Tax=Lactuca sativa TaxID=4236 RepID=A0A9R1UF43_LACSA|nr:hypothetical protein LSAT_V11C900491210 [Lactuca sativa]